MCKRWTRHDRPNRDKLTRLSQNGKKSWARLVPSVRGKCMVRRPLIYSSKVQSQETGNPVRECTDWLQPHVHPEAPIRADRHHPASGIRALQWFVHRTTSHNALCPEATAGEMFLQRIRGKYFMSHRGWRVRMQLLSSDWRICPGWRNSKSSPFCLTLLKKATEFSDSKGELKHQCERWVLLFPSCTWKNGAKTFEKHIY